MSTNWVIGVVLSDIIEVFPQSFTEFAFGLSNILLTTCVTLETVYQISTLATDITLTGKCFLGGVRFNLTRFGKGITIYAYSFGAFIDS